MNTTPKYINMPTLKLSEESFKEMIQYYVSQALAQPTEVQGIPVAVSLVVVEMLTPTKGIPYKFNIFSLEASTPSTQVESILATLRGAIQSNIEETPNAD